MKNLVLDLVADLGERDAVAAPADPLPGSLAEQELPEAPEAAPPPGPIPPDWAAPGAALCIAGRGPLDEAAAAMLAQLLGMQGIGNRLLRYEAVARDRIETLDMAGVRMICISYLELAGTPGHLRSLVRRLRRRAPGVPILVGLWPSDHQLFSEENSGSTIGADHYSRSLAEAVELCLGEAHERATSRPAPLAAAFQAWPRLFEACSNTSLESPGVATIRCSAAFISSARAGSKRRQRPSGGTSRAAVCGLSLSAARIVSARKQ